MDWGDRQMKKEKLSYVGKSVKRKDALLKVEGQSRYADDYVFEGMLYAAAVRSPKPRIKILGISGAKAEKIPGYVTLVTCKDIQGVKQWPIVLDDYPFLCEKESKFEGETVALVVAETLRAARQAAKLVRIKYKELPFLTDPLKSLEKKSLKIYGSDNVFSRFIIKKGDAKAAMKKADITVKDEFSTNYQVHGYLETQCAIAVPEPGNLMTVHSTTQCPFYVHDAVAAVLGIGYNKVKIIQTVTGGGFGGKEDVPALVASHAAICAVKTNRPVKLVYDRKEDFISMSKRHPSWSSVSYGAKKNGKITSCIIKYVLDGGAYSTLSPIVLWRGAVHAAGPYKIENILIEAYAVATNKVPSGAFRGFGQPQIVFAQESLIDDLSAKLNIDPMDLRLKNVLVPGAKTSTGQKIEASCGLKETLLAVRKKSDWNKKIKNKKSSGEKVRGMGVSAVYYGVGLGAKGKFLDRAGAYVNVFRDASVNINVGNTEMGQGALTVLSQIAAESLNAPYENIRVQEVDTSKVSDSGPTVASRTTLMSGNAIIEASKPLRDRIFSTAKKMLLKKGAKSAVVMTAFQGVFSMGGKKVSFKEVVAECWAKRLKMGEQGWHIAPNTTFDDKDGQGDVYSVYSFNANIVEVQIDKETGVIKPVKMTCAYDVGKIVNPVLAEGQAEGGSLQGMSWALYENLVYKNGKMMNPNFTDYMMANTNDKPEYDIIFVEKFYDRGPYKAKGLGEVPLIGMAGAVGNAVKNACGARIKKVPILPEAVWLNLKNKNKGKAK
ncbi:MAG: xanthine dehydrogenase family protein [Elusimicrobiales bacterium]|nr:xanthine dehydrogenase family protein [Elusimicrobiales bacterium]